MPIKHDYKALSAKEASGEGYQTDVSDGNDNGISTGHTKSLALTVATVLSAVLALVACVGFISSQSTHNSSSAESSEVNLVRHTDIKFGYDISSTFNLSSTAFGPNGTLPDDYTCKVANGVSPPLNWSGGPDGTKDYLVAMLKESGYMWSVFNMTADVNHLDANNSLYVNGGTVSFDTGGVEMTPKLYYDEPCSEGSGSEEYTFHIYAFSQNVLSVLQSLDIATENANPINILDAMSDSILGMATTVTHFTRYTSSDPTPTESGAFFNQKPILGKPSPSLRSGQANTPPILSLPLPSESSPSGVIAEKTLPVNNTKTEPKIDPFHPGTGLKEGRGGGLFHLRSPAVSMDHALPDQYTCQTNKAISPPLSWTGQPENTTDYLIALYHETGYLWSVYNMTADTNHLDADNQLFTTGGTILFQSVDRISSGATSFSYKAPCSPAVEKTKYTFYVYAFNQMVTDVLTNLQIEKENVNPIVIIDAMRTNIIAMATLNVNVLKSCNSNQPLESNSIETVVPSTNALLIDPTLPTIEIPIDPKIVPQSIPEAIFQSVSTSDTGTDTNLLEASVLVTSAVPVSLPYSSLTEKK